MASKMPPEAERESRRESMSKDGSAWLRQFVKHFELNFSDASRSLPSESRLLDYQDATIRAMLDTLLDSGISNEDFIEILGRVWIERGSEFVEWNSELNRRRFELIDKDIQDALSPAERIELAGLTRIMREQLDLETNLPLEGARALHRKLLDMDVTDKPR